MNKESGEFTFAQQSRRSRFTRAMTNIVRRPFGGSSLGGKCRLVSGRGSRPWHQATVVPSSGQNQYGCQSVNPRMETNIRAARTDSPRAGPIRSRLLTESP